MLRKKGNAPLGRIGQVIGVIILIYLVMEMFGGCTILEARVEVTPKFKTSSSNDVKLIADIEKSEEISSSQEAEFMKKDLDLSVLKRKISGAINEKDYELVAEFFKEYHQIWRYYRSRAISYYNKQIQSKKESTYNIIKSIDDYYSTTKGAISFVVNQKGEGYEKLLSLIELLDKEKIEITSIPEPPKIQKSSKPSSQKQYSQTKPISSPSKEKNVFDIGQGACNGEITIQVNQVKYVKNIQELESEYYHVQAPEGKKFAIIDLSIRNEQNKQADNFVECKFQDGQSYTYDRNTESEIALEKQLDLNSPIPPNGLVRGQISFLIPENAKNNKLLCQFHMWLGPTATFRLSDSETTYSSTVNKPLREVSKSATVKIQDMQVELGGLNPITLILKNEGDIPITPEIKIKISQQNQILYDDFPLKHPFAMALEMIYPNKQIISDVSIISWHFPKNGAYQIEVTLLDSETLKTLDKVEQTLHVQDSLLQQQENSCKMLKKLCEDNPKTCDNYELAKTIGMC